MTPVNDDVLSHLRRVVDDPDLSGTRYTIEGRLGEGGMGIVYRARDHALDREVALKVVAAGAGDGALAARMQAEAKALARLEHPNIVPVHDVGTLADGRVYYVMKHVRGVRLDAWLEEPRDLSVRLQLFLKICEAVSFAHAQGVIHRDLKPQNVMVGEFGEALVLDWGLAKGIAGRRGVIEGGELRSTRDAGDAPDATGHGVVLGTPRYMAPEQEAGDPTVDVRADVYALGRLLEDLTPAAAPRPLRAIREKATAAARADRYAGVGDMAADVNRFLSGLRVAAHAETSWETVLRHLARHRTIVVLIGAYLVLRLLGLLLFRR